MTTHAHRGAIVAVLVTAVFSMVAIACAPLPAERTPRTIHRDQVPELYPTSTTSTPQGSMTGIACFVPQRVNDTDEPELNCGRVAVPQLSAGALVAALAAGPDDRQHALGLTSFVPQNTRVLGVETASDGVLVVNLSGAINDVSSPNNTLAYRQIVETLTHPRNHLDIDAIRVKVDGKWTKIPTDDGPLTTARPSNFHSSSSSPPSSPTGQN